MLVKSQVKYIQSLSQKKLREQEGVFVAEGPKIINELLAAPSVALKQLFATEDWVNSHEQLLNPADKNKIAIISPSALLRISALTTPHEVLGIFQKPVFKNPVNAIGCISILLDTIQDPGNLGTILRGADWFGISQVICSEECADAFSTKVVQSSMGSICRVQVLYADLSAFLAKYREIPVYAAVLDGTDLYKMSKITEGMILIGNESKGIRPDLLSSSVHKITIPRKGKAESLNAPVATGIILSHLT